MRAVSSLWPKCSHRCVCKSSSTQPQIQPNKPLWERNGLNISQFKLFRSFSYSCDIFRSETCETIYDMFCPVLSTPSVAISLRLIAIPWRRVKIAVILGPKLQVIAIIFVIVRGKRCPHCGLAGDGDVCDRKLRRFAIVIFLICSKTDSLQVHLFSKYRCWVGLHVFHSMVRPVGIAWRCCAIEVQMRPFLQEMDLARWPPIKEASDTFKFWRHVMRANLSVRPKCSGFLGKIPLQNLC